MAYTTGDKMDTLQAALDFISGYDDVPPTGGVLAETELLEMIDEEREVFAFGDDVDHSSEDDVSGNKFSLGFPSGDNGNGAAKVSILDNASSLVESVM